MNFIKYWGNIHIHRFGQFSFCYPGLGLHVFRFLHQVVPNCSAKCFSGCVCFLFSKSEFHACNKLRTFLVTFRSNFFDSSSKSVKVSEVSKPIGHTWSLTGDDFKLAGTSVCNSHGKYIDTYNTEDNYICAILLAMNSVILDLDQII